MIDIRLLRDDLERTKAALARRGVDPAELDAIVAADAAHRATRARNESLRAEIKNISRQVGEAMKAGDTARADTLRQESRRLGDEERAAAAQADAEWEQVLDGLLYLPNIPADEVP